MIGQREIQGRRRRQLLVNLTRGHWKFKVEALDRTAWNTRSGRGYEPVVGLRYGVNDNKLQSSSSPRTRWW